MDQLKLSCIKTDNTTNIITLENALVVSFRANHFVLYDPSILYLGIFLWEFKSMYSSIILNVNFYTSFIQNSPKLETTYFAHTQQLDEPLKQNLVFDWWYHTCEEDKKDLLFI